MMRILKELVHKIKFFLKKIFAFNAPKNKDGVPPDDFYPLF